MTKKVTKKFCKTVDIFQIHGTIKSVETVEPFTLQKIRRFTLWITIK